MVYCVTSSGAFDSSGLLLPYPITSLALHITNHHTDIYPLSTYVSAFISITAAVQSAIWTTFSAALNDSHWSALWTTHRAAKWTTNWRTNRAALWSTKRSTDGSAVDASFGTAFWSTLSATFFSFQEKEKKKEKEKDKEEEKTIFAYETADKEEK